MYCTSIPISTASQSLSRDFLEPVGSLKDRSASKRIWVDQVCTLVAASPSHCSKLKEPRSSPGLTRYLESTPLKFSNSASVNILKSILCVFSVKQFLVYTSIKLPLHIQRQRSGNETRMSCKKTSSCYPGPTQLHTTSWTVASCHLQ